MSKHHHVTKPILKNRRLERLVTTAAAQATDDLRWLEDLLVIIDNDERADNLLRLIRERLDAHKDALNAHIEDAAAMAASRDILNGTPLIWASKAMSAPGAAACREQIIEMTKTIVKIAEDKNETNTDIASDHHLMIAKLENAIYSIERLLDIIMDNNEDSTQNRDLTNIGSKLVSVDISEYAQHLLAIAGLVCATKTRCIKRIEHDRYNTLQPQSDNK